MTRPRLFSPSRCATPAPARWLGLALIVLAAAFSEARGSTAGASLGHWLGQDLFPWLETELADHPRLAGRRLHIAAIDEDGKKQPLDALTGEIVNKISGHLVAESRLRVVLPANPDAGRIETPARDCDPWLGADMVIGVDTRTIGERRARITVRVLDPADQEWVAGLQRQWTGRLSRKQRDAQYRAMPGSKPEGTGNDPLLPDQPDVAANRLARVLACQVLTGRTRPVLAAATNGLTAFEISVRDALYATGAVSMSADGNAIVRVTGHPGPGAHRLAATLFETGTDDDADGGPSDRSTETPIVVASVHVVGVPTYPVGTLANDASKTRAEASPAGQTAHAPFVAVSPVRLEVPGDTAVCGDVRSGSAGFFPAADSGFVAEPCYRISFVTARDRRVSLLVQRAEYGLAIVRPGPCLVGKAAGNRMLWQSLQSSVGSGATWFAIGLDSAMPGTAALEHHLFQLPDACGSGSFGLKNGVANSNVKGLRGTKAQAWLHRFEQLSQADPRTTAWQGRHVAFASDLGRYTR